MQTKKSLIIILAMVFAFGFTSCRKPVKQSTGASTDSPMVPALPEKPEDYPVSKNDYLAALGRVLFYDKEMSANKNISCGSCHQQQFAFTDGLSLGVGTNNEHTKRNTPQVFARTGRFFWDGRATSMEGMVLMPVKDQREMNIQDVNTMVERLNSIDYYKPLVRHAFPGYTGGLDTVKIKAAVGEFMSNFTFTNNKFNAVTRNEDKFTSEEQMGKDLFFGTAGCTNCHRLQPITANEYYSSFVSAHNIGLDLESKDQGSGAVTRNQRDNGAFLTPVLMNVEYTAPYMHDGRFKTLEEVVEFYNSEVQPNPNLSQFMKHGSQPKKLNLTDPQKAALVAFLKTLSDKSVVTDKRYSDPFVPRSM